ncbi:MAG: isoleucine--tRNA ligase [Proteobacteria bacterium]|nr:isoleucine--tRNA ligase [Pseudomonadota bacterium]
MSLKQYPKTETKANFPELERQILEFWRTHDTFHKSLRQTEKGAPFSFYDGPPFANNLPHWGHLSVSSMKDLVGRYQTMRGRHVERELGWDCHGLPAEQSVEKSQKRLAKDIVADTGIGAFCDMCRADVLTYSNEWVNYLNRIGRWVDGGETLGYRTMDKNYMESVIWGIKQLYDKGYLYKDFRVNPYDWKFGTVLSNSEASQDYRDIVDDAVTVWFELSGIQGGGKSFLPHHGRRVLAWTTTPWTLPANSLLAVHHKMKYAVMRDSDGAEYIIAESRLPAYEKQFINAERIDTITGADIFGYSYKPLFDYYKSNDAYRTDGLSLYTVIHADYVSDDSGTGIVHIAPAFGEDDFWAAKNTDPKFPVILNVDDYGNFTSEVTDFAGMNIFDANPKIIEHLKKSGHLVKKEQYKHSYPFGDRSKEKLIYRATDSWYIDVPKIRDRLIENTKKTHWTSAGERFMKWIENARPWSVSRNRFWGTPLPIWMRNGEVKVFGSISEIEKFFGVRIDDLHRPTLDKLEKDGWKRIPDVLDCWVESGSMPFASLHYPFENKERFNATFPADYIIEGQDQTRGWFYSLMVLATALFDKPAFKTVSVNGMIVDDNKKKMSKSVGNFVDPTAILNQYGADAMRLFVLGSNFMKAEPVSIDLEGKVFNEPIKNILTPFWNAYHFFTLYANAGGITVGAKNHPQKSAIFAGPGNYLPLQNEKTNVLDRYILAELDDLIRQTRAALDEYKPDIAVRAFVNFLEILNNWYIRRSRERFWGEEQGAFDTLHFVLTEFCKLLAPFAPFISDYIFRALTSKESVHLEKFPEYVPKSGQVYILSGMRWIQDFVATGKALREKYRLRNRLPLHKMVVTTAITSFDDAQIEFATDIMRDELNIKSIEITDDISSVADSFVYLITPKIGARLGGKLKEIMAAVKQPGFNPEKWGLMPDEYEMRLTVKPGITGAALPDNTAVVVLDTTVTPELAAEGLARDALRFIQDSRRTAGLDVSDRIILEYAADKELSLAIATHSDMIRENILAGELRAVKNASEFTTEIEGHKFGIKIIKGK